MKIKKIVASVYLSTSIAFAGIPVIDAGSIAQDAMQNGLEIAEWAEQAMRWAEEVEHYKSQLEAYEDELETVTEIRLSVQFMKDLKEFKKFQNSMSGTHLGLEDGLVSGASSLYEKYNLFDSCNEDYYSDDQKRICRNKVVRKVNEISAYQDYKDSLDEIADEMAELADKLANSEDIKESQDIGNAIQLVVAKLDHKKTQVELMNAQNERLDKIEKEQKNQLFLQKFGKPDTRTRYPSN